MKIKRKKQLNLPQLIEYAWENDVRDEIFLSEDSYCVGFDRHGYIYFNSQLTMPADQTFTVEIEENITEDTELDLIERFIGGTDSVCYTSHKMSINKSLRTAPSDITITHFYIENDNRELVLIWQDGKLI
ncbi:hypothetical protein [Staphylococcus phage VB-SauS-SA2]|nr:hypothetical protein [Staphylococcus phage VB-SauS-SA2]